MIEQQQNEVNESEKIDDNISEGTEVNIPFVIRPRSNYIGKKETHLNSNRKLESGNIGVPNYWAFKAILK